MKSSKAGFKSIKRCKPLLGTFVEITLSGENPPIASHLIDLAFAEIEEISQLLSFHDASSELSRLNRTPVKRWMSIHASTESILRTSLDFQESTGGRFNVAVGRPLVEWDILPGRKQRTDWKSLQAPGFEIKPGYARRILPVLIDLGGIAKGWAVDQAVESIVRRSPQAQGCINAGGDLRAFGGKSIPVWIKTGQGEIYKTRIRSSSLATSSIFPEKNNSAYVDIQSQVPLRKSRTVSIRANRCVIADALTKAVLLLPKKRANAILKQYGADWVFRS